MTIIIAHKPINRSDTIGVIWNHIIYGNVYIAVDMELKGRIREAIMKMILEFDIKIE